MTQVPERTRLALVITELEVGGAERCLVNLALGLDSSRFDPIIFVLAPRPAPRRDALVRRLERSRVPVRFLGFASKWRVASAVRTLRRALQQARPQVVQSMLFHANVVSRLAMRPLRDTLWCAGIRVADPSRVRQAIEGRAIGAADRVVCVSRLVADYAGTRMKVPPGQIAVIPNGIDTDAVALREPADLRLLGVPSSKRAITCIARMATQKGIDQLLLAAPQLLRSLPDHDLLLVGDGPQATKLLRMAGRTGVAERIHFCGWQPNVGEILLASDLLVLPSRWEGMPNVLLEAMACSRPTVCTRVEGVLEVLGPLAPNQTVPVGQPQALATQVVKILGDPVLARQLGTENRQWVADHFSLPVMVRHYETLYSEALNARKSS